MYSNNGRRIIKKLFLISGLVALPVLIYHQYTASQQIEAKVTRTKYILYWSPLWNTWDYMWGYGFEPFKNCDYNNCYTTRNRTLKPIGEFDALIFYASYDKKKHGVPSERSNHQKYILMFSEAPAYICPDLKQFDSYFNWTMSYRFDSDIVRRHGYIIKTETNYTLPTQAFIKGKKQMAAWFVSNCKTPGHRENLVKELQKHLKVDVYGSCGKLKCDRMANNTKLSSDKCYSMLEKKYKFYLSFENSYCLDYSTEKLYNVLKRNVIPVVYGFGDYSRSAPPNSVIDANEFMEIEELVRYLKYLYNDVDSYLEYFEWKKHYKIETAARRSACELCKSLHQPIVETVYENLHEWWWGKQKTFCRIDEQLPKMVSDLIR